MTPMPLSLCRFRRPVSWKARWMARWAVLWLALWLPWCNAACGGHVSSAADESAVVMADCHGAANQTGVAAGDADGADECCDAPDASRLPDRHEGSLDVPPMALPMLQEPQRSVEHRVLPRMWSAAAVWSGRRVRMMVVSFLE